MPQRSISTTSVCPPINSRSAVSPDRDTLPSTRRLTVFAEEPDHRHPCLLRSPRAANLRDELATLHVIELRSVCRPGPRIQNRGVSESDILQPIKVQRDDRANCRCLLGTPEISETIQRQLGVAHRVLDVPVTKPSL